MTLEQAKIVLRLDDDCSDVLGDSVKAVLESIPSYIEVTTGMTPEQQETEPLVRTVSEFLLRYWFETSSDEKMQRAIDHLLKAITLKVKR